MQKTESPADTTTGISSLMYQTHGHAVNASFLPSSPFMKAVAQHRPENKCPFVLCPHAFPSLLPMASLPCFLLSACQKDVGCCTVQLRGWGGGASCPQTTLAPQHCAVLDVALKGPELVCFAPYNDCQPLSYRTQNRTNKSFTGPDGASRVLTFY